MRTIPIVEPGLEKLLCAPNAKRIFCGHHLTVVECMMEEIYHRLHARLMGSIARGGQPLFHLNGHEAAEGCFNDFVSEYPNLEDSDYVIEVLRREVELFHEDETGVRVGIEDEDVYRFLFQTLDNETLRDAVVPWLLRFCYLTPTDRQIAAASNELGRRRQDPAFARMARPNAGAERRLIQIYEAALARANPNLQRLMHPFEMLNFGFYAAYLVLELLYARSDSGGNAEPMRCRLLDGAINRNTAEVFQIELQHLHNEIQDGGIERLLDYRDVNMNVLPQWRPENIAHRIKHYLSPARFQEFQALVNFHDQFQNDVGHKTIQAMAILSERLPPD